MKSLSYTLDDAHSWATFSGDTNPIHFDRKHARMLGGDELIVHGMRAMLDVQNYLMQHTAPPPADWLCFAARIRRPLWCNHPYRLQTTFKKGDSQANAVILDGNDVTCLEGKLLTAERPQLSPPERYWTLCNSTLAELAERYPSPGAIGCPWIFLQAVLFRQLLNSPQLMPIIADAVKGLKGDNMQEVFATVPLAQTHHEVQFSPMLCTPYDNWLMPGDLRFTIHPPVVTGDLSIGASVLLTLSFWRADEQWLQLSVSLKTWPIPC